MKKIWLAILVAAAVLVGYMTINAGEKKTETVNQTTVTEEEVSSSDVMAMVERSGGLCPGNRACGDKITIYRDGKMTKAGTGEEVKMATEDAEKLRNAITKKNVEMLKLKKFTGLCPTAYDGMEVSYIFVVDGKEERISSCEYEISEASLLIGLVVQALQTAGW